MKQRKKVFFILGITASILGGLYTIGHVTGMLKSYKFTPGSNVPAIKPGERIFSSNLLSPKRYDIVCFYHRDPERGKQIWAFRLCGMPGDTLLIKNGDLYINGRSADDSLNLNLFYVIPSSSLPTVTEHITLTADDVADQGDTAIALLTKEHIKLLDQLKVPHHRYQGLDQANPEIEAAYKQPWTTDNFGPVVVPSQHYFVLGDNRYMAQDSRYIGFVPEKDLHGVVLGRH